MDMNASKKPTLKSRRDLPASREPDLTPSSGNEPIEAEKAGTRMLRSVATKSRAIEQRSSHGSNHNVAMITTNNPTLKIRRNVHPFNGPGLTLCSAATSLGAKTDGTPSRAPPLKCVAAEHSSWGELKPKTDMSAPLKPKSPDGLENTPCQMRASSSSRAARPKVQKQKSSTVKIPSSRHDLYESLHEYILTPNQLQENGFPRPVVGEPGTATILVPEESASRISNNPLKRICRRCETPFTVTPDGDYVKMERCVFHWGRCVEKKAKRRKVKQYYCCRKGPLAKGCETCMAHVHMQNTYDELAGYVETFPDTTSDGNCGIFALDCEMIYTTGGFELARITVVNHKLDTVYGSIVKPSKPVIDFNTRFSGLTPESFRGVTTTIKDVQVCLLRLFTENTILIGHSLESDLKALKMIHSKIVDTSMVFPHRDGLPKKRSLKNLCRCLLKKDIQDDESGHDSTEDACAAMELMLYKIRQDARDEKENLAKK